MTLDDFAEALRRLTVVAQGDGIDLATVLVILEEQAEAMRSCDD